VTYQCIWNERTQANLEGVVDGESNKWAGAGQTCLKRDLLEAINGQKLSYISDTSDESQRQGRQGTISGQKRRERYGWITPRFEITGLTLETRYRSRCWSRLDYECETGQDSRASDSPATYGALQMCFDWLIDWLIDWDNWRIRIHGDNRQPKIGQTGLYSFWDIRLH